MCQSVGIENGKIMHAERMTKERGINEEERRTLAQRITKKKGVETPRCR